MAVGVGFVGLGLAQPAHAEAPRSGSDVFVPLALTSSGSLANDREVENGALSLPSSRERKWVIGFEGSTIVFSDDLGMFRAGSVWLQGGRRFGDFTLGLHTGLDYFRSPVNESDEVETVGVWMAGIQAELRYLRDLGRAALAMGINVVTERSHVDDRAGSLGFYIDGRPAGVRFPFSTNMAFGLDPLGIRFLVADSSGIPLTEVQFLSSLRLEGLL
jgi:hypothetical protein